MKIDSTTKKNVKALKAISDPARLAVVNMLLINEAFVSEIIKKLKIEPTLLSHHLSVLKKEGVLVAKRDGKRIQYKVAPKVKVNGKSKGVDLGSCKVLFK